jgi:hypothetical protein
MTLVKLHAVWTPLALLVTSNDMVMELGGASMPPGFTVYSSYARVLKVKESFSEAIPHCIIGSVASGLNETGGLGVKLGSLIVGIACAIHDSDMRTNITKDIMTAFAAVSALVLEVEVSLP